MSKMKILVLDIETSPNLTWAWDNMLYQSSIPHYMIIDHARMLCWAAKWVGKKTTYFRHETDKDFLEKLWDLMDAADAVVHYNGKKFDRKFVNMELIEAGFYPPAETPDIDLLPIVRKTFKFPSYKLDYVASRLLGEQKKSTGGFGLWPAYMEGKAWARKKMREYNIEDVRLTEEVYKEILGWIPNHPNHGLYVEDQDNPICRNCGSDDVKMNGDEYDASGVFAYKRLKCNDCGANLRGRSAVKGSATKSLQVVK